MVPYLNWLESPSPNVLCVKFNWNWHGGAWEEYLKILSTYFWYYLIISPWEKAWPFSWRNLNPLLSRLLCAKFGWNWHSGSREEYFKFHQCILAIFGYYLPFEKAGALHLKKIESPSPKDALCQVWLKLVGWFWCRRWKYEKFTTTPTPSAQVSYKMKRSLTYWRFLLQLSKKASYL